MVNDVCVQFANPALPFGGLGPSGMGSLHGRYYFEACSQKRGVVAKGTSTAVALLDLQVTLRAPPYTRIALGVANLLLTKLPISMPPRYGYKALAVLVATSMWYVVRAFGWHVDALRFVCTAVLQSLDGPADTAEAG